MKRILKRLLKGLGRTTEDGPPKDGTPTGCKNTESSTKTSSPYDIEVKKAKVRKIVIKD